MTSRVLAKLRGLLWHLGLLPAKGPHLAPPFPKYNAAGRPAILDRMRGGILVEETFGTRCVRCGLNLMYDTRLESRPGPAGSLYMDCPHCGQLLRENPNSCVYAG